MQHRIKFNNSWMFSVLSFRTDTINRKRPVNQSCCELSNILSSLLVATHKHEFEEILATITKKMLPDEVYHQV
jgi:hypothetical protein